MLSQLYIENIAVIEHADICFMDGFNVLSGETGAGKSIIIDSLNAILGARVSRELIRTGENRAVVAATFELLPERALKKALQLGFEAADNTILLRREMFSDGRNTCRINGQPATLAIMRELGAELVNIHGQHDGQHLLNELLHIDYLDAFAGIDDALADYLSHYEELLTLNRRIKSLSMSATEKQRRRDELEFQIEELTALKPKNGEFYELSEARAQLMNFQRITESATEALTLIAGTDDIPGAAQALEEAEKSLASGEKYSTEIYNLHIRVKELSILAKDVESELSDFVFGFDFSAEKLAEIEERLDKLHHMMKKYGTDADELEALCESLKTEFELLDNFEDNLGTLKQTYTDKREDVLQCSKRLHSLRVAAAQRMKAEIERELSGLDMPSAKFFAEITNLGSEDSVKFTKKGTDNVRFLLTANSGEEPRPIAKVASGGELSRIMLALKSVMSRGEEKITAVFDEIDAGVSGRAASHVGEKMYAISKERQVLCITHLPQIAALSDHQYRITKSTENGRTFTQVTALDSEGRADELARLTAGVHVTEATLESAFQLLQSAEKYKTDLQKDS